jgi:predicted histidine transporter YuiF (NhaC family)
MKPWPASGAAFSALPILANSSFPSCVTLGFLFDLIVTVFCETQ